MQHGRALRDGMGQYQALELAAVISRGDPAGFPAQHEPTGGGKRPLPRLAGEREDFLRRLGAQQGRKPVRQGRKPGRLGRGPLHGALVLPVRQQVALAPETQPLPAPLACLFHREHQPFAGKIEAGGIEIGGAEPRHARPRRPA